MAVILPKFNLKRLWTFVGQQDVRDEVLAKRLALDSGSTIPHGNYTRLKLYSIRISRQVAVDDSVLDIFDEDGEFRQFVWDGVGAWVSRNEKFCVPAGIRRPSGVPPTGTVDLRERQPDWPRNRSDTLPPEAWTIRHESFYPPTSANRARRGRAAPLLGKRLVNRGACRTRVVSEAWAGTASGFRLCGSAIIIRLFLLGYWRRCAEGFGVTSGARCSYYRSIPFRKPPTPGGAGPQ